MKTKVAACVVVMSDGRVLVVRRPASAPFHAGLHGLPGGKIDAGESPRAAAVRELREETGIVANAADLVPLIVDHPTLSECDTFLWEPPSASCELIPLTASHEGTPEWASLDELSGECSRFPAYNAHVVELLRARGVT